MFDLIPSDQEKAPLALRLARSIVGWEIGGFPSDVGAKARICLLDFLGGALEACRLPWSRQAAAIAASGGNATIIGGADRVSQADAAFANAVSGHGLVRDDMHAPSLSHLGTVVWPALLAFAQQTRVDGRRLIAAGVIGYEVGAKLGRALAGPDFARRFRPTGFTGPVAAAAACAHLIGLDERRTASAIALAANMVGGLNQWPYQGGEEMFFHAGLAARNATTAVRLAECGALGSERALDGEAGLLPTFGSAPTVPDLTLFDGEPEILAVYCKPVPACNFAQTPCLAMLELVLAESIDPEEVSRIELHMPRAAKDYPGCDHAGPFAHVLQAKMSIPYAVASALLHGTVDEAGYRNLADPRLLALTAKMVLQADDRLTAAFPQRQGAEVTVTLQDGRERSCRLADIVPADESRVRRRFREAAAERIGPDRTAALEQAVDCLAELDDAGKLMELVGGLPPPNHRQD